jgi:hypothetical protein
MAWLPVRTHRKGSRACSMHASPARTIRPPKYVQHAREPGKDHPPPEIRGMHQVLPVGFAYGCGVLGEQSVHIHITNSTIEPALRGCEDLAKWARSRNNIAR